MNGNRAMIERLKDPLALLESYEKIIIRLQ
jgi:hypothetical protein